MHGHGSIEASREQETGRVIGIRCCWHLRQQELEDALLLAAQHLLPPLTRQTSASSFSSHYLGMCWDVAGQKSAGQKSAGHDEQKSQLIKKTGIPGPIYVSGWLQLSE